LKKANPDRVWAGLKIPVHMNTSATFAISIVTSVGNRENTLFWSDHWLHGSCSEDLAPNVVKCVPPRKRNIRTMREALHELNWVADISGLSAGLV